VGRSLGGGSRLRLGWQQLDERHVRWRLGRLQHEHVRWRTWLGPRLQPLPRLLRLRPLWLGWSVEWIRCPLLWWWLSPYALCGSARSDSPDYPRQVQV